MYLAVVLDVFSRWVVGWSMTHHLRTELVLGALNMALGQRRPQGVVHHSDQGSQYTSFAFGKRCREMGVVPSTGSAGDCFDNAMAESFFATLECELIDRRSFRTQAEARMAIFQFIEGWLQTHAAGTPPWVTSAPTTSNAPRRRQRHVRCATLIVRLEASPVLPRAASQKEKHTLRGDPIDRSWGRLYVHRLSPTSGLGGDSHKLSHENRGKLQSHVMERYPVSERRACLVLGQSRTSQRYSPIIVGPIT